MAIRSDEVFAKLGSGCTCSYLTCQSQDCIKKSLGNIAFLERFTVRLLGPGSDTASYKKITKSEQLILLQPTICEQGFLIHYSQINKRIERVSLN